MKLSPAENKILIRKEFYMETITMKSQSSPNLSQSDLLAKKALKEHTQTGHINQICPKCLNKLTISREDNRTVIKCQCYNVYWEYINI